MIRPKPSGIRGEEQKFAQLQSPNGKPRRHTGDAAATFDMPSTLDLSRYCNEARARGKLDPEGTKYT